MSLPTLRAGIRLYELKRGDVPKPTGDTKSWACQWPYFALGTPRTLKAGAVSSFGSPA
jgi:hypothetical protein